MKRVVTKFAWVLVLLLVIGHGCVVAAEKIDLSAGDRDDGAAALPNDVARRRGNGAGVPAEVDDAIEALAILSVRDDCKGIVPPEIMLAWVRDGGDAWRNKVIAALNAGRFDPNTNFSDGSNLLHQVTQCACALSPCNHTWILRWLLTHAAVNLNATYAGDTPRAHALKRGKTEIYRMLQTADQLRGPIAAMGTVTWGDSVVARPASPWTVVCTIPDMATRTTTLVALAQDSSVLLEKTPLDQLKLVLELLATACPALARDRYLQSLPILLANLRCENEPEREVEGIPDRRQVLTAADRPDLFLLAAHAQAPEVISWLLSKGFELNNVNANGRYVTVQSLLSGNLAAPREFSPCLRYLIGRFEQLSQAQKDVLAEALCRLDSVELASLNSALRGYVNYTLDGVRGNTLLMLAVHYGSTALVDYLCTHVPASINNQNGSRETALDRALAEHTELAEKRLTIVRRLIASNIAIPACKLLDSHRVLHALAATDRTAQPRRGDMYDALSRYLESNVAGYRAELNQEQKRVLAFWATKFDKLDVLQAMVNAGNNLGAYRYSDGVTTGRSLLHYAAIYSLVLVIHYLCTTYPVLVNQPDSVGDTPLHLAMNMKQWRRAHTLIGCGADSTILNNARRLALTPEGKTLLMLIIENDRAGNNYDENADILFRDCNENHRRQYAFMVNFRCNDHSAMEMASSTRNCRTILRLLEFGADQFPWFDKAWECSRRYRHSLDSLYRDVGFVRPGCCGRSILTGHCALIG